MPVFIVLAQIGETRGSPGIFSSLPAAIKAARSKFMPGGNRVRVYKAKANEFVNDGMVVWDSDVHVKPSDIMYERKVVTKTQLHEMIKAVIIEQSGPIPSDGPWDRESVRERDYSRTLQTIRHAIDAARNLAVTRRGNKKGKVYQVVATELIRLYKTMKTTGV